MIITGASSQPYFRFHHRVSRTQHQQPTPASQFFFFFTPSTERITPHPCRDCELVPCCRAAMIATDVRPPPPPHTHTPPPPPSPHRSPFQCWFTSTETIRLIRDREPRTATVTLHRSCCIIYEGWLNEVCVIAKFVRK